MSLWVLLSSAAPTPLGGPNLRTLRSIAVVSEQLVKLKACSVQGFLPRPAVTMLRHDVQSLFGDLDAMVALPPPQRPPIPAAAADEDGKSIRLQSPQETAFLLEEQTEELASNLQLLEEQQSESRAREVFDMIDTSGDGVIQLEEFQRAARCLIDDQCTVDAAGPSEVWDGIDTEIDQVRKRREEAVIHPACLPA